MVKVTPCMGIDFMIHISPCHENDMSELSHTGYILSYVDMIVYHYVD